jgi:hypothetical protein
LLEAERLETLVEAASASERGLDSNVLAGVRHALGALDRSVEVDRALRETATAQLQRPPDASTRALAKEYRTMYSRLREKAESAMASACGLELAWALSQHLMVRHVETSAIPLAV